MPWYNFLISDSKEKSPVVGDEWNVLEDVDTFRDAVIAYVWTAYENASDEQLSQLLENFPENRSWYYSVDEWCWK